MGNSIRWTEEQLQEVRMRMTKPEMNGVDIDAVHRKQQPKESKLERRFDQQLQDSGLPEPRRNYFFLDGRNFELDRAWPERKVAVEIQGGAHRAKGKWQRDIEKRALAMLAGWRVLEVDWKSIRDGHAIEWTKRLFQ